MTIKEIEEAAGMQRANIRFYEEEGFLHPEREKNGYRNYSAEDLKILQKIKLLRSLHISLEEIKAMHSGEQELEKTLQEHIDRLAKKQEELGKSQYVCEKMQKEKAEYDTLDTRKYLLVLKNCRPEITEREEWVERDTPEPLQAPFLRIFARLLDYALYIFLWMGFVWLWNRLVGWSEMGLVIAVLFSYIMWMPLALLLEPRFLHLFGTTLGKALLGLRVTYDLGGPIPKDVAWTRSWRAVLGRHDWKYDDVWQMIQTFNAMEKGEPLEWDYVANTTIELKDDKTWRKVVCGILLVICFWLIVQGYKYWL